MNKKSLLLAAASYLLWGILPLYWGLLNSLNPVFILANRILWSGVFTIVLLAIGKKLPLLWDTLKNRQVVKYLLPAAAFITVNWGLYIYAVNSGHVMDASLGYYLNPLVVSALSILLFKEKCTKMELFALLLALVGVVIATVQAGSFPYLAVIISISFACYGACKKYAHVDSLVSVCAETLFVIPLALLFLLLAPQSRESIAQMSTLQAIVLLGGGVMTAVPLIMFAKGVNDLPFIVMGFLQFISPTCMFIIGLLQGEAFDLGRGIAFGFIWAGVIVFVIGMMKSSKAAGGNAELRIEN